MLRPWAGRVSKAWLAILSLPKSEFRKSCTPWGSSAVIQTAERHQRLETASAFLAGGRQCAVSLRCCKSERGHLSVPAYFLVLVRLSLYEHTSSDWVGF